MNVTFRCCIHLSSRFIILFLSKLPGEYNTFITNLYCFKRFLFQQKSRGNSKYTVSHWCHTFSCTYWKKWKHNWINNFNYEVNFLLHSKSWLFLGFRKGKKMLQGSNGILNSHTKTKSFLQTTVSSCIQIIEKSGGWFPVSIATLTGKINRKLVAIIIIFLISLLCTCNKRVTLLRGGTVRSQLP